jgi:adenine-specific DNA-methyltransferase
MRYIGCKRNLLSEIQYVIDTYITNHSDIKIFADIFSGTGTVARYFKSKYKIISNDILFFSYVLQYHTIVINDKPSFNTIKKYLKIDDIYYYLETFIPQIEQDQLFIFNNYSPNQYSDRMYFTNEIAKRIDYIRITIETWKKSDLLSYDEYMYLLGSLLETIPSYSNISGTYGAYLKHWDKRVLKPFILYKHDIINNSCQNKSYNDNANNLIASISGDILYIDPPYNQRQYLPNYHLLETIAKYDYPIISGKTGIRNYIDQDKSSYCKVKFAKDALEELIAKANFQYIIISYNNEGIINQEQIENILMKYDKNNTVIKHIVNYRKYKNKTNHVSLDPLYEMIYLIKKY